MTKISYLATFILILMTSINVDAQETQLGDPFKQLINNADATAKIKGQVYLDANANGRQDPGEPGLPNVQIIAVDGNNEAIETFTKTNGKWKFSNLSNLIPGRTQILILRNQYKITDNTFFNGLFDGLSLKDAKETEQSSTDVNVEDGKSYDVGKSGYAFVGNLSGRLYEDSDESFTQNDNESGIKNVDVQIENDLVNFKTTTPLPRTDTNGDWSKKEIPIGDVTYTYITNENNNPDLINAEQTEGKDRTVTNIKKNKTSEVKDGFFFPDDGDGGSGDGGSGDGGSGDGGSGDGGSGDGGSGDGGSGDGGSGDGGSGDGGSGDGGSGDGGSGDGGSGDGGSGDGGSGDGGSGDGGSGDGGSGDGGSGDGGSGDGGSGDGGSGDGGSGDGGSGDGGSGDGGSGDGGSGDGGSGDGGSGDGGSGDGGSGDGGSGDDDPGDDDPNETGTLTGHLYLDENGDGTQNPGESDLPNVNVQIDDVLGNSETVMTDANGDWSIEVPVGIAESTIVTSGPNFPTGAEQTEGTNPTETEVKADKTTFSENDGFFVTGILTGHLYLDENGNGTQNTGEANLPNIDIEITDSQNKTQTVSTDTNGDWSITIPTGEAISDVDKTTLPEGAEQSQGTDPTTTNIMNGGIFSEEPDGFFVSDGNEMGTIAGKLYLDENGNGTQDLNEPGIESISVEIEDEEGNVETVETDFDGNWSIEMEPGEVISLIDETDQDFPENSQQTEGTNPTLSQVVAGEVVNKIDGYYVPQEIEVFNAISPNGDGQNDFLKIEGLSPFTSNSIKIFNRSGVKVYDIKNYGKNGDVFKGISNGRITIRKGEKLPSGTYFYIIRYEDDSGNKLKKQGYLYIN